MTNPYLINAMQQQQGQQLNQPMEEPMQRQRPSQQAMPQERYNPFDKGIRAAIESARTSIAMSEPQQQRAIGQGLDAWRNVAAQQPRQRGFLNNLGSIISGMNAGMQGYQTAEAAAQTENQAMAEKLLAYEAQEQARRAKEEDRAWNRDFHERQLGEQVRNNNLLDQFRRSSLARKKYNAAEEGGGHGHNGSQQQMDKLLDIADKQITGLGSRGARGTTRQFFDRFTPQGRKFDEDEAKINTLGEVLKGQLFRAWGYRNQAEFEHVPTISADNPPEVNKSIIRTMKALQKGVSFEEAMGFLGTPLEEHEGMSPMHEQPMTSSDMVLMRDPETGEEDYVHSSRVEQAMQQGGLQVVE